MVYLETLWNENNTKYEKIFSNKEIIISIKFKTNDKWNGIQYLTKEQTYTKSYPFMFS